ncbi:MAG: lycopene cyclase family protein, partial [Ktedonobacterales bacterium]
MEIETMSDGTSSFDVLIVGTGPAGLLAAYDVLQQRPATSILLVDAGPPLAERRARGGSELEGYGGAGLYIGGRLYLGTFSIPVMPPGTPPREMHAVLEGEAYARRAQVVDEFFKRLGAESEVIATPPERLAEAVEQAAG